MHSMFAPIRAPSFITVSMVTFLASHVGRHLSLSSFQHEPFIKIPLPERGAPGRRGKHCNEAAITGSRRRSNRGRDANFRRTHASSHGPRRSSQAAKTAPRGPIKAGRPYDVTFTGNRALCFCFRPAAAAAVCPLVYYISRSPNGAGVSGTCIRLVPVSAVFKMKKKKKRKMVEIINFLQACAAVSLANRDPAARGATHARWPRRQSVTPYIRTPRGARPLSGNDDSRRHPRGRGVRGLQNG